MLLINSDDYEGSGIETLFFPGGEPHCKIPDIKDDVILNLKIRSPEDLLFGACVISALAHSNCKLLNVFIPYFPGARQDKIDGRSPYTLKIMTQMLCSTRAKVCVFDPHSRVLMREAAIHKAFMPSDLDIPFKEDVVGIIAPDSGAVNRAKRFRDHLYPKAALVECTKHRDPKTGELSQYRMPPLPTNFGRYIVVDDICDGGGTFNLLALEYQKDPFCVSTDLELFVSHGIFSKGLGNISGCYDKITTTDSWCPPSEGRVHESRLTILPLLPTLLTRIQGL